MTKRDEEELKKIFAEIREVFGPIHLDDEKEPRHENDDGNTDGQVSAAMDTEESAVSFRDVVFHIDDVHIHICPDASDKVSEAGYAGTDKDTADPDFLKRVIPLLIGLDPKVVEKVIDYTIMRTLLMMGEDEHEDE